MDKRYARYCSLMDRKAAGAVLTEAEEAFCAEMEATHATCQGERAFMTELSNMEGHPGDAAHALVQATMDAIADGELDDPPEAMPSGRPLQALRRPAAFAVVGLAVAIVGGLFVAKQGSPASKTATRDLQQPRTPIGPPRVELVYASGATRVDGVPWTAGARTTALLRQGQRVEVDEGRACLVLDPDINVCLDAHSELVLDHLDSDRRRLSLQRGRVALSLFPQPAGSSVTVTADGVESTAIGTTFSVAKTGTGIRTTVLEGKVRVVRAGESALVSAHERHEVSAKERRTESLSRRDEAPEWAVIQATRLWRDRLAATLTVDGTPDGASVWLDGERIGMTPLSSLVPAGVHQVVVRTDEAVLAQRVLDLEVGQRRRLSYDDEAVPVADVPAQTRGRAQAPAKRARSPERRRPQATATRSLAAPSPSALLAEARRLMLEGMFERAAQTYEALRRHHSGTPEARTVLVPLAELRLERLNDATGALALLDAYLEAGGPLSHEARYTRIRALRRLDRTAAERAAIEELLDTHPNSFHAPRLQARLARLEGDR